MDDIVRLGRDEGLHRLVDDFGKVLLREDAALHGLVERFTLEQFHYDKTARFILPHVEDGDDVRVIEAREGLCLRDEFVGRLFDLVLCRLLGREHSFDRHFALELGVERLVYGTEASFADLLADFVAVTHR